jgi:hypothetical protein
MQQPARRRSPGDGGAWAAAATVDEASMERSKNFIKALQVLPAFPTPPVDPAGSVLDALIAVA